MKTIRRARLSNEPESEDVFARPRVASSGLRFFESSVCWLYFFRINIRKDFISIAHFIRNSCVIDF